MNLDTFERRIAQPCSAAWNAADGESCVGPTKPMQPLSRLRARLCAMLLGTAMSAGAFGASYDLAVVKTGPAMANAGDNVTYTIVVTNNGPDNAANVTLTDQIPQGLTYVSYDGAAAPSFTCTQPAVGATNPDRLECTSQLFAAGASQTLTITFNIPANAAGGSTFTNVANVTSPFLIVNEEPVSQELNDENNSSSASTQLAGGTADLSVVKTGPAAAAPDSNVTYTIVVTNFGPAAATMFQLTDTLPGTMTYVSLSQSGVPLSCTVPAVGAGGTITCTTPSFVSNGSTTLTLTARIPAGTTSGTEFGNTATVTTTTVDPNEDNNASTANLIVSAVDMSVLKSGPPNAAAGANLTYTITVTNTGPDAAMSARLVDAIPAGTTFVSFAQNTGSTFTCQVPPVGSASGTIDCLNTLFTAQSALFTLVLRAGDGVSVTNTASVSSDSFDTNGNNNTSSVTTAIAPAADVSVLKTGPVNVTAGTNATYQITVTNAGPSSAANVSLFDAIPANTSFVSFTQNTGATFACNTPGPSLSCTIASMGPGTQATFTLVLAVAPAAQGGSIMNTATVSTTTAGNSVGNDTSSTSANVVTSANLGVTKSGPQSVNAGATAAYTIVVANAGPSDATAVTLTDALPAGTTFASSQQTNGPMFACTTPVAGSGGTLSCTIATLAAGASATFGLTLNVLPNSTGSITNTANVASMTADATPGNNAGSVTSTVTQSSDVAVTKTGPANVDGGTDITWTIAVVNNGPSNATGITLTDALPTGTTFVSLAQAGPAFMCTTPAVGANGTVSCSIPTLAPASTTTFTLRANVALDAPSPVANVATVASASTDPTPGNNSATASTAVVRADVSIVKSGPTGVAPGQNLTYQLTVANAGPSAATTVTMTDVLPAGITFKSLAQDTGPAFTCTTPAVDANGTVTCTIASLASGASATFTLVAGTQPGASGTVSNTATVAATTPDPSAPNNTSTVVVPFGPSADIVVTKTGPASANAGGTASYAITVVNNGPSTAASVSLADALPAQTTFVSFAQGSGPAFTCATPPAGGTGTVTCTIASLAPGTPATFTLVLNVANGATGTIANTATASAMTGDPNTANNSATATTAVGTIADVSIAKTGSAAVTAGQTATYTIVVSNAGPAAATGVTMTDTLPADTTFASLTQTNGPAFNCTTPAVGAAGTVSCTLATLASGASASFTLVVNVSPNATAPISNTATVTTTSMDPTPGNGSAAARGIVLLAQTDIDITKTGSFDPLATTKTITWSIVVRNLGPGVANNVIVSDTIQSGTMLNSVITTQGTCAGDPAITCTIGVLQPGASATITLVTTVTSLDTAIANTASATTDNPEATTANNAATAFARFAPRNIPTLGWPAMAMLMLLLAIAGAVGARRGLRRR